MRDLALEYHGYYVILSSGRFIFATVDCTYVVLVDHVEVYRDGHKVRCEAKFKELLTADNAKRGVFTFNED